MRDAHRREEVRLQLAQESARLMSEDGIRDYHVAKRKAAQRIGIDNDRDLPSNREIEAALREYQRLFQSVSQPKMLRTLRAVAVEAMRFFARFDPRLVGAVLEGTADEFSAVCLHLFDDDPTEVLRFLDDQGIPYDEEERTLRLAHDETATFPALRFDADATAIDLTIMPRMLLRQPPVSRTSNGPMQRASINALLALIAQEHGG